jgi:hypothetical protein
MAAELMEESLFLSDRKLCWIKGVVEYQNKIIEASTKGEDRYDT